MYSGYGRGDYGRGGYGRSPYGQYSRHGYYGRYGHPYYGYSHYHDRYGYDLPYYYRPGYIYSYPYFVPTFSFGLSFWDTPSYYADYGQPAVVYAQPVYGSTSYYSEPAPTYYADSGTTYIESEVYAPPAQIGTTYVERQVERQYAAPSTQVVTAAPRATTPPSQQSEAPVKQPDPRVLAAVGQGNEHFGAGRYSDARRSYGEAMSVDDTDGVAMLLFGLASFAEGDHATAATITKRALDATPDLIYYPFNVKALYRDPSKFQDHIAALARHADVQPGDHDAQFLLGYMWYASGDAQNARTMFGTLAARDPNEELYVALRDASTEALESLSKQPPQSAPIQPAP